MSEIVAKEDLPAHSTWSASGFARRMQCPGSHVLEPIAAANKTGDANQYSAWGTVAHELAADYLRNPATCDPYDRIGEQFLLDAWGNIVYRDCVPAEPVPFRVTVDEEMAACVADYAKHVAELRGDDGSLFVETRVFYGRHLGERDAEAFGTADAIIVRGDELIVCDLKTGMGVEVDPTDNPQLMLYALGAWTWIEELIGVEGITRVRLCISQPRVSVALKEHVISVADLLEWAGKAQAAVYRSVRAEEEHAAGNQEAFETFLSPGEECKFCKARATCPKLRAEVASTVFDLAPATPDEFVVMSQNPTGSDLGPGFDDEWLAASMAAVDLIEDWCKAVRAEVESRLLAGKQVTGWKLVEGRRGNRQWTDKAEAEKVLKGMRLKADDMYTKVLVTPPQAEKLVKAGTLTDRQWQRVRQLITQSEGKPSVAPESDKRPPLVIGARVDEFDNLSDLY